METPDQALVAAVERAIEKPIRSTYLKAAHPQTNTVLRSEQSFRGP
jgi:hypothetical protein